MKTEKTEKRFRANLFGKVITPLSYYLKGDFRFKYFNEYKKNLTKSRKEIEDFQLSRLKALVKHAYDTVPYYKELFDKNGIKPEDIKKVEDLKKIPPLDKKTVMSQTERLKSTKKYKLIKAFSGGSTGNKITVFKDKRYYEISSGVRLRDLYSVGIDPGDKCAWVWFDTAIKKSIKRLLLDYLICKVNRRLWFNIDKYSDDKIAEWLSKDFNRFKPDYIFGFAGTIYEMAKVKNERNIKTTPVKVIVTTSERLENRGFIEKVFNCPVIDMYGCAEVLSIAFEDKDKVMHTRDDFVIVELGDNNEVLLTPLESYGMPLLRYKPGDMGMLKKKPSKKSPSPFKEFNLVIGRVYETMINKKGEKIGGGLIKQYIEDENIDVYEFQLVQKTLDLVELNIVKDDLVTEKAVSRMKQVIKETLGATKIKVNYLKTYPVEPNGKRIAFKCEVKK